tara:strand:+ start:714 stop:1058 length:345 start_codon:yes stop_codon:yes gene_type:complete
MPLRKPFHTTPQGGSILCLEGLAGRIFRACYANQCTYTDNLHSAKSFLDFVERKAIKFLPSGKKIEKIPFQRKTTLKWNEDGSLSSIDMARILSRLEQKDLTECDLSCEWGTLN